MYYALPYKTKQFFFVLIKLGIIVAAIVFVYMRLTSNSHLTVSNFIQVTLKNNIFSFKTVISLLLLSTCNWGIEIFKWRFLVNSIANISFVSAVAQSFGAFTVSLFTPNRIGEYGAKALYFEPAYRKKIMLVTFISNGLQMGVTVILGCFGLFAFSRIYNTPILTANFINYSVLGLIVMSLCIVLLYNYSRFVKSWFLKFKKALRYFSKTKILIGFIFSLCRYMVFSFQFYLLLVFFNTGLSYANAMYIITSSYLLASLIPALSVLDVVIKGGVAVFLFAFAGVNAFTILTITTLMWLLNAVIPSFIGCFYVARFKYPKLR